MNLRGELKFNHNLAPYTTWRIGGPARVFYQPADLEDLLLFLPTVAAEDKIIWLGKGSNVLIRDHGLDAVVIHTAKRLNRLEKISASTLRVEAGVLCGAVAKAVPHMAWLAGIPGTIGGALAMNAGAFGSDIWSHVVTVETVDRYGNLKVRQKNEFSIGYREVEIPRDEWFIAATFALDNNIKKNDIAALMKERALKQPLDQPSCGSVFRNPPGDHAARLIEAAGLKGKQIGGAKVSLKHANFIINVDKAKARDVEELISLIKKTVFDKFKITLITEVVIL